MKFGFVPGQDSAAYRIRRRYRLIKGGHPQLILIHYSRGPNHRESYLSPLSDVLLTLAHGTSYRPGLEHTCSKLSSETCARPSSFCARTESRPESPHRWSCHGRTASRRSSAVNSTRRDGYEFPYGLRWKPSSHACATKQQYGCACPADSARKRTKREHEHGPCFFALRVEVAC